MNDPTIGQLEARQFFVSPCKKNLLCVIDLALDAFDEWPDRWEKARAALQAIGLKHSDEEIQVAFAERQNQRSAS